MNQLLETIVLDKQNCGLFIALFLTYFSPYSLYS
jgi:hypothetical protein